MNKKHLAKDGIWIIMVNGKIYDEYYNEEIAIKEFEYISNKYESWEADIVLSRVLRTTKINEYPDLDTIGFWRVFPTVEGVNIKE